MLSCCCRWTTNEGDEKSRDAKAEACSLACTPPRRLVLSPSHCSSHDALHSARASVKRSLALGSHDTRNTYLHTRANTYHGRFYWRPKAVSVEQNQSAPGTCALPFNIGGCLGQPPNQMEFWTPDEWAASLTVRAPLALPHHVAPHTPPPPPPPPSPHLSTASPLPPSFCHRCCATTHANGHSNYHAT
jgi:hypothetical protein